jgi:hypothetical protein
MVYGFASLVTAFASSFTASERLPLIYFLVVFPVLVLSVFTWLVSRHSGKLFAPSDFKNEDNYVKMQMAVVASLTAASAKNQTPTTAAEIRTQRSSRTWDDVKAHAKATSFSTDCAKRETALHCFSMRHQTPPSTSAKRESTVVRVAGIGGRREPRRPKNEAPSTDIMQEGHQGDRLFIRRRRPWLFRAARAARPCGST